jgi:hypothetical protein
MSLVVAQCTRTAAKHAVEHWHYSQTMPSGRLITYGVWEDERYVGAVVFGRGANDRLLAPYGLRQSEGCELVRVALRDHVAPVSQVVSLALRKLRETNPGLRIVISFADPAQGHHGGIYQAGNWFYLGRADATREFVLNGRQVHERSVSAMITQAKRYPSRRKLDGESRIDWLRRTVDKNARAVSVDGKHRYAMPLDRAMRKRLQRASVEYPERAVEALKVTR